MLEATKEVIAALREFDKEVSGETSPVLSTDEQPGLTYPLSMYVLDKNDENQVMTDIRKHCDLSLIAENDFFFVWSRTVEEHSRKMSAMQLTMPLWLSAIQPVWEKTQYAHGSSLVGREAGIRRLLPPADIAAALASQGMGIGQADILDTMEEYFEQYWGNHQRAYVQQASGDRELAQLLCWTKCETHLMARLGQLFNERSRAIGFVKECRKILFEK